MIGKGKSISHTQASMMYGWDKNKDADIIFKSNLLGENPIELTKEFKLIQNLNETCKRNTLSFVISPAIDDGKKLSSKDLKEITSQFIAELKLGDRQAVAFVHNDKDHKHIHLYVNRIDFNGIAYNDSYIGKKCHVAAHNVAEKLGLRTVKETQKLKRDETKTIRSEIRDYHLQAIIQKPRNIEEYTKLMLNYGIKVIPSINKQNQVQGLRFEYMGHNFKASEVHRTMSYNKIKLEFVIEGKNQIKSEHYSKEKHSTKNSFMPHDNTWKSIVNHEEDYTPIKKRKKKQSRNI